MRNPRLDDERDIYPLTMPNKKKIKCTTCAFRAKDEPGGNNLIPGAEKGYCDAFSMKPVEIIMKGETCPYYMEED